MDGRRATRLLLLAACVACGELSRHPDLDAGGPEETPDAGEEEVDAGPAPRHDCSICPFSGGYVCLRAECVTRCEGDDSGPCGEGEHCRMGACLRDVEPGCAAFPCNADQVCFSDYCSRDSYSESPCQRLGDPVCGNFAECDAPRGECVELPPWDRLDTCHAGTLGAVCNFRVFGDGRLTGTKGPGLCLIGRCAIDDDCPADKHCVDLGAELEGLGVCR